MSLKICLSQISPKWNIRVHGLNKQEWGKWRTDLGEKPGSVFPQGQLGPGNLAFRAALKPISPRKPFPDVNQSAAVSDKFGIISQRLSINDPEVLLLRYQTLQSRQMFSITEMPPCCQENYPQLEAGGILLLFFHFTHRNAFWVYSIPSIHKKSKERGKKGLHEKTARCTEGFLVSSAQWTTARKACNADFLVSLTWQLLQLQGLGEVTS